MWHNIWSILILRLRGVCCPFSFLEKMRNFTRRRSLQLEELHLFNVIFYFLLKNTFNFVFSFERGIWVISTNSIFVPVKVLSTHLTVVICFHLLNQDAKFSALVSCLLFWWSLWNFLPVSQSGLECFCFASQFILIGAGWYHNLCSFL